MNSTSSLTGHTPTGQAHSAFFFATSGLVMLSLPRLQSLGQAIWCSVPVYSRMRFSGW
ncbi:uncharacterized protein SETTUDRAFT_165480 [Exserohilum turcica Et28A]|uniref:Uncharacterized protein n=1 Tax=Exserohilum turcicum (strain 28A) TaxID=671987 RepID=R0K0E1_EXST2|nr:uncharacterized protein SETTUDRAFT_165480 [Exserohilum turcica Et28A]EOA81932.1 hypothetical protein SETTUDRAFT_165480 [Exserohilum turcica Et28A]